MRITPSLGKVLITGSAGMLAQQIIELLAYRGYSIIAASSRSAIAQNRDAQSSRVVYVSNADLLSDNSLWEGVVALVHCAFTRNNDQLEVISSMRFAEELFSKAKVHRLRRVINISTRSVYLDPAPGMLNTEQSPVGGGGSIGLGKVAVEMFLELLFADMQKCEYSSLRVASVNEVKLEDAMRRPMNVFVQKVISGAEIEIQGGQQVMSYIDPRDVAEAVAGVLECETALRTVYNVGTGWVCTKPLLEIAELVRKIGVEEFGLPANKIKVTPSDVHMNSGLSIERIKSDIGWAPKYSLEDMIRQLFKMYLNVRPS